MMQENISAVLDQHALWLDSHRAEGTQAILVNRDLRFADLAGRDLREAVLTSVNLERANLQSTRLAGADMRKCNLAYADMHEADLEGANLAGAKIEGADLSDACLDNCILEGASLESATLRLATLNGVNARKAKFTRANLALAILDEGKFDEATFNAADLTQASLRDAQLKGASLRRAILSGAELDGANFRDADLTEAILVGASTEGAMFEGARIPNIGLEVEEGTLTKKRKNKKFLTSPAGITASRNERLYSLLRKTDELKAALKSLQDEASDTEQSGEIMVDTLPTQRINLEKQLAEVETQRRITQIEIRREQERVEKVQDEIKIRVENATDALRAALGATNYVIRVQRLWSAAYRSTAFVAVLASLFALSKFALQISSTLSVWTTHAAWLGLVLPLLVMASLCIWFDMNSASILKTAVARREKVDGMIGLLNASQFISLDINSNRENVEKTFSEIRRVLLEPSSQSGRRTITSEGQ